ncbi:GNAT family N-acetyltransferase [Nocardioides anomalus]|uniref:GNAT family N-acetyltransferase n=1 Tax=Nocardioides anomalus TaxID=2712223 RepID=A0A6G6WIR1_9ACTN|nr:GNAT family N-acetyltransferase [Nocardioides anomalus]QIG45221.1 GNAT family N-acetyltransferase [Nocardioides anomalus]
MSRKVVRLTVDHLAELEGPCRTCLFWQLDPVARDRVGAEDAAAEREAWVSQVLRDWGSCGRVVLVDDRPVGYLIYAPDSYLPGAGGFATAPISPDAVLLTNVWVHPDHAGGGLGRMLVQGMARDLIKRGGFKAVEAFGDTRGPGARRSCVVPADFLGSVGFKTQRAHGATPRMRMELRAALSLKDEVEAALERLVGVVRPKAAHPAEGRMGRSDLN